MTRKYYRGYGLTELRTYAREYQIPGRSKMTGDELLVAVTAVWDARRVAAENEVRPHVQQGALLRFKNHTDCVIRVTSEIRADERTGGEALYVRAEYVSMCSNCDYGRQGGAAVVDPHRIAYHNRSANGGFGSEPYRFFLHSLEAVPGADRCDHGNLLALICRTCDAQALAAAQADPDPLTIDPAGPAPAHAPAPPTPAPSPAAAAAYARADALQAMQCCGRPYDEHPKGDPTMMGTCSGPHAGTEVRMHWDGSGYTCGLCAVDAFHTPAPDDDPARCGATSFSAPHPFEPGAWQTPDSDGYYEYETCLRPADDPIHLAARDASVRHEASQRLTRASGHHEDCVDHAARRAWNNDPTIEDYPSPRATEAGIGYLKAGLVDCRCPGDEACDDDPTPRPPAGTYRFEARGTDGTWTTVGTGGTDFVALGAVALGRQAQVAAQQYRTRTGTLGPVRCTIEVPGGPGASAEAGPVPSPGGRADLPPGALVILDSAYAYGRVDVRASSRIGDALAALGWLHRGELIGGAVPVLRYYPAGDRDIRYAVEVAGPDGWREQEAGTRRAPVATADVLDAVATAIADVTDGGGAPVRVTACAGPTAYAVAYAAAPGPQAANAA